MRRYSGLLLVSRLQSDLNRLFESALQTARTAQEEGDWVPAVDMRETDESVLVRVDVPGVPASDLRVRIEGDLVAIEGVKTLAPPAGGRFHCMERSRGRFVRKLRLATATDPRRGEAHLEDGLLVIALPKIIDRRTAPIELAIKSIREPGDR